MTQEVTCLHRGGLFNTQSKLSWLHYGGGPSLLPAFCFAGTLLTGIN